MKNESIFFNSESDQVIYYLACLDGKARMDKLGANLLMYSNKKSAKKWYDSIREIIDQNQDHTYYTKALKRLNELYDNMTDH